MGTLGILLVEDHEQMRGHLKRLLAQERDFRLVAEAGDGDLGLRLALELRPDVLITDLKLPGISGLQVVLQVHRANPDTAIVVVTVHGEGPYVKKAFMNGARAYVLKDTLGQDLVPAVRAAVAGRSYIGTSLGLLGLSAGTVRARVDLVDTLTGRERLVLELAAAGCADEVIAVRLSLDLGATGQMRSAMMRRFGLLTHADLVAYARERGLLPQGGGL